MKTILVVDDEEAVVEFVASLLEEAGYRVLRAYDGQDAMAISKAEHPDLIITDIMMPIMNGIELCHVLRETPATENIPVIFMTAGRMPRPGQCDAIMTLAKPFDLSVLERAIAQVLPA